jgi:hypothetical protein
MLQINTPNGLYTFRERDTKPGASSLLWVILPPSHSFLHYEDHTCIEEVAACIAGNDYNEPSIHKVLRSFDAHVIEGRDWYEYRHNVDNMRLICTDTVLYVPIVLRRRFQLIDDYLIDNPTPEGEVPSITLPFAAREVRLINPLRPLDLASSYNILCYLNPKSNLSYFYCNLKGVSLDILTKLSNNLTVEERANLVQYGTRRGWKVPSTEGIYILGLLDSVRNEYSIMREIYEKEYPSYLFCTIYGDMIERREIMNLGKDNAALALLKYDFTIDPVAIYDQEYVLKCVKEVVIESLELSNLSLTDYIKLVKMAGLTNIEGARSSIPPLPYDVPPYADAYDTVHIMTVFEAKMAEMENEATR